MRRWGQILLLLTLLIGVFGVQAQTINTYGNLVTAINNTPSGGTITLTWDIAIGDGLVTGDTAFPTIDKTLTIDGGGFTISRTATNDLFGFFHVTASGNLTLKNITLTGGSAPNGGAIYNKGTIQSITNSTFLENSAHYGGAIYNDGTIRSITNSTFLENSAHYGGAIRNTFDGRIEAITNSTFSENSADTWGGAILNHGTIEAITNSTFSQNTANKGGAIYHDWGTIGAITNSTFSQNTANEGGAIWNDGTIQSITNSVIAGTPNACYGTITGSNNLRDGANDCADSLFLSNTINPAIHLGALADNGGPTQTIALLNPDPVNNPNPAINSGDSNATTHDQRDVPAQGTRDIGAYEFYVPTVEFSSISQSITEADVTLDISLTITQDDNHRQAGGVSLTIGTGGTATAGDDYQTWINPILVTFDCGVDPTCTTTFPLTIYDDDLVETDETIILEITSAIGATIGMQTQHTITIENDDIVPTVVDVLDVNGSAINGATYDFALDQLTIQFDMPVFDDGTGSDPDSASNPANYILLTEGAVAGYQTADCASGVSPDDEQISFASVSYDSANYVTTLTFNPALNDGDYRLIICGTTSIVSAVNRALHLNNGVDVSVDFTVAIPVTPTPVTPTSVTPTPVIPTPVTPTSQPTAQVTAIPTVIPTTQAPAPQPAQPEDLGVFELPATGERPLWAELLAEWLGW
jgi:hypothetical protein